MTTLYHYCPVSTFESIISNRSIWLSSLNMSNDTMEGKLVAEIFLRLANTDGFDKSIIRQLEAAVSFLESNNDGLGFCLSQEGDLLSQWRGYAADATGFSVGFSKEYLSLLSKKLIAQKQSYFNLIKVEYNLTEQENCVRPMYEEIKQIIESGLKKVPRIPQGLVEVLTEPEMKKYVDVYQSVQSNMFKLFPKLYALKIAAFSEEKEWRLLSFKTRDEFSSCSFRALSDRIVPFREFQLSKLKVEPITNIIIGPKNLTPTYVVKSFLEKNDFNNVAISHSSATYR